MSALSKILLVISFVIVSNQASAELSLNGVKQVFADMDWDEVNRGQVVDLSLGDREGSDAELAMLFAAKVDAPLRDVLDAMHAPGGDSKKYSIDISSSETIASSLQHWINNNRDSQLTDWFYQPENDGTFNVSGEELARFKESAKKAKASGSDQVIYDAIKTMLQTRIHDYVSKGMAGIQAYDIKGKQVDTGGALASSVKDLSLLKKSEPEFYSAFVNFPQQGSDDIQNEFFLISEMEGGRPILSLVHWIYTMKDDHALIVERKYYISHTLDAMHTYIFMQQQDASTVVVMGNSTFTQKVTGMGSFIAHKVGRANVASNIKPILSGLQNKFNK
ncbi:MAG: hypothetical protein ACN2B6_12730 [Rickettsiales bacterium]